MVNVAFPIPEVYPCICVPVSGKREERGSFLVSPLYFGTIHVPNLPRTPSVKAITSSATVSVIPSTIM